MTWQYVLINVMSTLAYVCVCVCVCVWTLVPTFVRCVHIARIHISFSACFHNHVLFLRVDTDAILITLRGDLQFGVTRQGTHMHSHGSLY
jgi:hypothetical protein